MTVTIELFGIPRQRAGSPRHEIHFPGDQVSLEEVLRRLSDELPALSGECIRSGRLAPGYAANLRGERFVTDAATILCDGDELLLLSADAGG